MTSSPTTPRRDRRVNARRKRLTALIGGIAALAVLVAAAVVLVGGGSSAEEPRATDRASTTVPTTVPTPATTAPPKPAVVATSKVPSLQVFDAPGSTKVMASLPLKTEYLAPRTLLVTENQGEWLKALLPIRPNQAEGWIRAADVTLSENPYKIEINLARNELVFSKAGKEILRTTTVDGTTRTPTPVGTYYITDPVDLRNQPNGAYGAYALGLSAHSEVLFEFNGGPGQVAIHGTNEPQLMGQDASNGCIRVTNDVIVQIALEAPLGTPVVIT